MSKKIFPLNTVDHLDFDDFQQNLTPAPILNLSKVQSK